MTHKMAAVIHRVLYKPFLSCSEEPLLKNPLKNTEIPKTQRRKKCINIYLYLT